MHELTLAVNLKNMIEKTVKDNSCTKVSKIIISLGEFSNIYKEALEFSLDVVKKDTVFSDADIEINMVKPVLKCIGCDVEFNPDNFIFVCPRCGSSEVNIVTGDGMVLDCIEAE